MGIITGLLTPTSGDVLVGGRSIVRDPRAARASIGICPQQNVLFEQLTVEEHVRLFCAIKGVQVCGYFRVYLGFKP